MVQKSETRLSWIPGAATVCSILACYGTLTLLSVLSMLGISITLHEGAWATAISVFAVLAAVGAGLNYRRHLSIGPVTLASVGALLVLWTMFGSFNRALEIAGFVALVAASIWDWKAGKRRSRLARPPHQPRRAER